MKVFIMSMIAGLALCACTSTKTTKVVDSTDTVEVVDSVSCDSVCDSL